MTTSSRTIFLNTLAQLVAKGVAVLLTLLFTFFFLRQAGPELFGEYSKVLALVTIGFTAIDFGLNAHVVRQMSSSTTNQEQLLLDTILARLLLSLLAYLALNLLVLFLPGGYSGSVRHVFWFASLAIVFQGLFTSANAWFQHTLSYWKSSLVTIISTLLGTSLSILVLFHSPTLASIYLATLLGYLAMGALPYLLIRPLHLTFSLSRSLSLLKSSLTLGTLLVLSVLASKIDVVLLGVFRTSAEVGYYSFAYRVFDVALVLPVFVMNSVYPLLLRDKSAKLIHKTTSSLLLLGLLGSAVLYVAAPLLLLVKPDLFGSVTTLRLLSLSLPLFYLTAPLMWELISASYEKKLLYAYGFAALLNFILNYLLIPHYGIAAPALITAITELSILLSLLYIKKSYVS